MKILRQATKFGPTRAHFHTHHGFTDPRNIQYLTCNRPTISPTDTRDKILIQDLRVLKSKLRTMKRDGIKNLSIVSDFDRTLTQSYYEGKAVQGTLGMIVDYIMNKSEKFKKEFQNSGELDQETKLQLKTDKEFRHNRSLEWIEKVVHAVQNAKLTKETVQQEIFDKAHIVVRPGVDTFFKLCAQYNVPFYIVSAGLSNIIGSMLGKHIKMEDYPGLHLYSNEMLFNEEGELTGFKEPYMHVVLKENIFERERRYTKNILILGDHLKDQDIAFNMKPHNIIKLGYINYKFCFAYEKSLSYYAKSYDASIVNNTGLGLPERMIRYILDLESEQDMFKYIDSHVCTMPEAVREISDTRTAMNERD